MKSVLLLTMLLAASLPATAQMYQTVPADQATLLQRGSGRLYCPNCGMHLVKFYRTGHALAHQDGTVHQYCSLHCLVEATPGDLAGALVVDNASLAFVPAPEAFYVVGSDRPGTMTMNSKYAFADRAAADGFAAENGGEVVDFTTAEKIARDGLDRENAMIGKKRAMAAEKGRTIVEKMCPDVQWPGFDSIAAAKTYLAESGVCGQLKDEQYQAAAIYLAGRSQHAGAEPITVPEKAKCPVCGMFVAKYPKWAASVELNDGRVFYFDGVKDMMKFAFAPEKYVEDAHRADFGPMRVTDYYTLQAMAAGEAWYVTGSNVYGPMGDELIPFRSQEDARTFQQDHFGEKVLRFMAITEKLVLDLDR